MASAISANKAELLAIANSVATEKMIDKSIVLEAMEEAIQRERDALETEADTGGMSDRAVCEVQTPFLAEGVLVVVEAHAGGLVGLRGDRDEQLELQVLVALVVGEQTAGAAEERIVGHVDLDIEAHRLHHLDAAIHPEFRDCQQCFLHLWIVHIHLWLAAPSLRSKKSAAVL